MLPLLLACAEPAPATAGDTGAAEQPGRLSWTLPAVDARLRAGLPVEFQAQAAGLDALVLSSDLDGELGRWSTTSAQAVLADLSTGTHQLRLDGLRQGAVVLSEERGLELSLSPAAPELALEPALPTAETGLELVVLEASDPEGDALTLVAQWFLDGEESDPPGPLRRDQQWAVEVAADDGLGPGPASRAEVVVGNAVPVLEAVELGPEGLRAGQEATCSWTFADADGDTDASTVQWSLDGVEIAGSSATLTGDYVGGQLLRCTVTPGDGIDLGEPVSAEQIVANSPPVLASVSLGPTPATEDSELLCDPGPTTDPDGDSTFSFGVAWWLNGVASSWVSRSLDGDDFDEGDQLQCQLTPSDGEDEGEPVLSAVVTVVNSLPGAPTVEVSPDHPVEGLDGLSCTAGEATDPDGDPLEYTLSWTVDGLSWGEGAEVPVEELEAGQTWTCTAVASDEEGPGESASASVKVRPDQPQQAAPGTNMSCLLDARGALDCWGWDGRQLASTAPDDEGWASIALGSWNGCALDEAGGIRCWGGEEDCISDAPTTDGWAEVDVGYDVCCALDGDGALSCWGDSTWELVDDAPTSGSFRGLSVGSQNICVLDEDGAIECWGSDSEGVVSDVPDGTDWAQVAVGYQLACARDHEGSLQCWGEDYEGAVSDTPLTRGHTALSVGERFACALDGEGGVQCWGRNDHDQVDGAPTSDGWEQLDSWGHHSCVMDADGDWQCWARNDYGQCVQPPDDALTGLAAGFSTVCGLTDAGVVRCWGNVGADLDEELPGDGDLASVHAGLYHFCALDGDGALSCFGWDEDGQVADAPTDSGFQAVGLGYRHSCAVDADGAVQCWGADDDGQVSDAPAGSGFTWVQAGYAHGCALDADGAPWCWGSDGAEPFESPDLDGLEQLSSAWAHACGLDADGLAHCWGVDDEGQVSEVPTDTPFTLILALAESSCALDGDGLLQCFGGDDADALETLPDVALDELVAGYDHLCGRSTDGGWGCWGSLYVDRW